jgi:hypothetical protein
MPRLRGTPVVAPTTRDDSVTPAEMPTPDDLVQAALDYTRSGFGVFPLHTPINGVCDCPRGPECGSPGKHPRTLNGLKDASRDEMQVRRWWKTYTIANIGLAVPDGYVVVDVDGPEGQEALRDTDRALPATAIQTTGRGAHYLYRTLDRIPPRSNLMPKVDLRGPGSYIVAAPSVHASGACYSWAVPLDQVDVAPRWLEEVGKRSGGTHEGPRAPVDFEEVLAGLPEGARKWEIYRAASKLRGAGVPIAMAIMLAREAAANCIPPLPGSEAERKVREAYAKHNPNLPEGDLPADVTLLSHDMVRVTFDTCQFVFSDLEKSGRELHAEMEVQNLQPGTPQEPYIQRLNLLSMSARDQCRREIEHVLGSQAKGHWTALLTRAISKAQNTFLSVDRSVRSSELEAPPALEFVIPDICVADGISILFGAGSAGKTFLLMRAALDVSRGDAFLGRSTRPRNVLYIDCETGRTTYAYRLRRLLEGVGLGMEAAANVYYWWAQGIPLEDQVDAIRRCCEQNQIEFLCLDHIAAACSGDALEQSVASRFQRAVGKIGLPMLALAHITGAAASDPEQAERPFGSIFWENNARRTIFILRQQADESPVADLGLYPKKINDGGRTAPFAARITFDDPTGPITVDPMSWGNNQTFDRVRGAEFVLWNALTTPQTVTDLADMSGFTERHVKRVLAAHPTRFVTVSGDTDGGRGKAKRWARIAADSKGWAQRMDEADEIPF